MGFKERASDLGVELERRPAERIVITGFAQRTPLGNTEETQQGLMEGKSGVRKFPIDNAFVNIGAPVEFRPEEHFDKRELRGISPLNAMGIVVSREAAHNAKALDNRGKLKSDIGKKAAVWIGSGFGSSQLIIDVYRQVHKTDEKGNEDQVVNSRYIPATKGLEIFPEELNSRITIDLGASGGWGGSSVEACATGLSNIVEAIRIIKEGRAKFAIAGGFENPLVGYPETGIGMFAAMRSVLSTRNDEPEKASRPFDKDRNGFVLGAGGGVVIVEELEAALKRGAPILAEVLGFKKSMDGFNPTNLDRDVVASTILGALYNEKRKEFYDVDAIFAHATSTEAGDIAEAEVLRSVFGDEYLRKIPITAIKSNMGHLAGGAGAVNAIAAINALNCGRIPPIVNLENPDPAVSDLSLVRGKPLERDINTTLVLAYGFGGNNAVLLLGKYK